MERQAISLVVIALGVVAFSVRNRAAGVGSLDHGDPRATSCTKCKARGWRACYEQIQDN